MYENPPYYITAYGLAVKRGFIGTEEEWLKSRGVKIEVIQDKDCEIMMKEFIERHPELWNEDIGE